MENNTLYTIDDLKRRDRKKVIKEFRKQGVEVDEIKESLRGQNQEGQIIFTWSDCSVGIPAPSQRAIDEWFKEHGSVIAGAVAATIGSLAMGGIHLLSQLMKDRNR